MDPLNEDDERLAKLLANTAGPNGVKTEIAQYIQVLGEQNNVMSDKILQKVEQLKSARQQLPNMKKAAVDKVLEEVGMEDRQAVQINAKKQRLWNKIWDKVEKLVLNRDDHDHRDVTYVSGMIKFDMSDSAAFKKAEQQFEYVQDVTEQFRATLPGQGLPPKSKSEYGR